MTPQVRVGVAVLIRREGGELLVGMRKGKHGDGTWSVPGGHLEFGEAIEDCASREIMEETGLTLTRVSKVFAVTNDIYVEDGKHYLTVWVEGTVAEDATPVNCEPDKCHGWEWLLANDIPQPRFMGLTNLMAERKAYFS